MQILNRGANQRKRRAPDTTVSKSEAPRTVAGFSFGKFRSRRRLDSRDIGQSFADQESTSSVRDCDTMSMPMIYRASDRTHRAQLWRTMTPTGLNRRALAEGELACNSPLTLRALLSALCDSRSNGLQLRPVVARTGLDSDLLFSTARSAVNSG